MKLNRLSLISFDQNISITIRSRVVLIAAALFALFSISCTTASPATEQRAASVIDDSPIGRAFASRASNIQVQGEGTVIRMLSDDVKGGRHQRFIVQLASGQTLLMTHNIDLAPRIVDLKVGDSVDFNGEYIWNTEGGIVHWTHHDPQGTHVGGWIKHNGQIFQ